MQAHQRWVSMEALAVAAQLSRTWRVVSRMSPSAQLWYQWGETLSRGGGGRVLREDGSFAPLSLSQKGQSLQTQGELPDYSELIMMANIFSHLLHPRHSCKGFTYVNMLILTTAQRDTYYYDPHFKGEGREAQREGKRLSQESSCLAAGATGLFRTITSPDEFVVGPGWVCSCRASLPFVLTISPINEGSTIGLPCSGNLKEPIEYRCYCERFCNLEPPPSFF